MGRERCSYCVRSLRPLAGGEVLIDWDAYAAGSEPCIGCEDLYRKFPWLQAQHRAVAERRERGEL
jgi:hypothetical protein